MYKKKGKLQHPTAPHILVFVILTNVFLYFISPIKKRKSLHCIYLTFLRKNLHKIKKSISLEVPLNEIHFWDLCCFVRSVPT